MSVYYQTFVLCGYKFEFDEMKDAVVEEDEYSLFDCSFYHAYSSDNVGDIVIIADGRAGNYAYFGQLLAKSNSTRDGEQSIKSTCLDEETDLEKLDKVKEILGRYRLEADEPKYHIFTHVT